MNTHNDHYWKEKLTPEEFQVLRRAATEPPFVGIYTDTTTPGIYSCKACGQELFSSQGKFHSGCGWPSFYQGIDSSALIERQDHSLGMVRIEILCSSCHSHLGHVFDGEGFNTPTDRRYCINSIALSFKPQDNSTEEN